MMNIATHKQRRNSVEEAGGKFKANLRISDKFVLILHIFLQPFASYRYDSMCMMTACATAYWATCVNGSLQMVVKNMQNQNKFVGNSQSFKFAPPPLQLNSAAVYVLQYSSFWNHKAKSYGITKRKVMASKLQVTASKLQVTASKLQVTPTKLQVTPTKLQVTRSKLTSLTAETNKL